MTRQVAVCGPADCTPDQAADARRVGELLAGRGAVVLCGGGPGVMAAVAAGASGAGGVVVGVRGDDSHRDPDGVYTAVLASNLGQARNAVLVWSADAVVVVGGSWGTLSELALARRRGGVPVISLHGWRVTDADGVPLDGIAHVESPEQAVDLACGSS
jgi:uncharacterized protein (TIGR00725 family)